MLNVPPDKRVERVQIRPVEWQFVLGSGPSLSHQTQIDSTAAGGGRRRCGEIITEMLRDAVHNVCKRNQGVSEGVRRTF